MPTHVPHLTSHVRLCTRNPETRNSLLVNHNLKPVWHQKDAFSEYNYVLSQCLHELEHHIAVSCTIYMCISRNWCTWLTFFSVFPGLVQRMCHIGSICRPFHTPIPGVPHMSHCPRSTIYHPCQHGHEVESFWLLGNDENGHSNQGQVREVMAVFRHINFLLVYAYIWEQFFHLEAITYPQNPTLSTWNVS